jgi:hypothetical protein
LGEFSFPEVLELMGRRIGSSIGGMELCFGEKWAEPTFNAIAFYLHMAGETLTMGCMLMVDMLSNEGL